MGEIGMKIKCEYSMNGIGWSYGWVVGFVFDSTNTCTNAVVEKEDRKLVSTPICYIKTSDELDLQKGTDQ